MRPRATIGRWAGFPVLKIIRALVTPSPQLINAARAFLKDNDIVCIPSEDNRVGALGGKLQALRKDAKERFQPPRGDEDSEGKEPLDNVVSLRVAE